MSVPSSATAQKPEMQEIATLKRDILLAYYGNTLAPTDETLISRGSGKGLRLYDQIERDCHVYAVLTKRRMAVIARPWEIDAASESRRDKKAAELVREAIEALPFDRICLDLLDATLKGFSVGEVMWGMREGMILPVDVLPRAQNRFVFTLDGELRLITREKMVDGEELPARKFIVHRWGAKDGSPYGLGLGSRLFWPVLFKRQSISFWLIFADKFGSPTAIGKYPVGTQPAEQDKLLAALTAISQEHAIVFPDGMVAELLEASRTGSSDLYERLARYLDEEMSKTVLGETMTTSAQAAGMGSSQADVHQNVRMELAKADSDLLSGTLNDTLVRWIVDYNMPGAGYPTVWRDFDEAVDTKVMAERDQILVNMGLAPSDAYIEKTYGGGWTRVVLAVSPAGVAVVAQSQQGATAAQFSDPAPDTPDAVDVQAVRLSKEAAPAMQRMISHLQGIVDHADSLEGLRDDLLGAYGHLPIQDLTRVMTQAFAAAQAGGRFDVSAE